jgi:hypothetical protein
MTEFHYRVGQHDVADIEHSLVDRGANGGICGNDMLVLEGSQHFVDVVGLAGHKVNQLQIVTAQALVTTHKGDCHLSPNGITWQRKKYPIMLANGNIWSRNQRLSS